MCYGFEFVTASLGATGAKLIFRFRPIFPTKISTTFFFQKCVVGTARFAIGRGGGCIIYGVPHICKLAPIRTHRHTHYIFTNNFLSPRFCRRVMSKVRQPRVDVDTLNTTGALFTVTERQRGIYGSITLHLKYKAFFVFK